MFKLLLLGFCLVPLSHAYSQSEPSMEFTYAYLNKKAQEANGHYRYHATVNDENKRGKYIYDGIEVSHITKTNEIQITYNRNAVSSGFNSDIFTFEFNPKHIKSIVISTTDQASPVGLVVISLAGKTGKFFGKKMAVRKSKAPMKCYCPFYSPTPRISTRSKKPSNTSRNWRLNQNMTPLAINRLNRPK